MHTTKIVTKAIGQRILIISRTNQSIIIHDSITIAKAMKTEEKSCLVKFVNIQFPNERYLFGISSKIGFESPASTKFKFSKHEDIF